MLEVDKDLENGVKNKKKQYIWMVLFLCIAVGSIFAIIAFNKSFSWQTYGKYLKEANLGYLVLAILSVILFIFNEGWSISCIVKSFGYKPKTSSGFFYSAADIYFSAITPSASGGQPATAYFMYKDGISGSVITVSLLYTLLMYSLSIIFIGLCTFVFFPALFFQFDFLAKLFIGIGFLVQIGLVFLFYCFLYRKELLNKVCSWGLNVLCRFHLLKNKDEKMEKLNDMMKKYQESAELIRGKKKVLGKVFLFNLFQRICQISVIVFVFLAVGGSIRNAPSIWGLESLVIMGAYAAPIPGAMGVTDYLMLNGFKKIMAAESAVNLELLSRGISFYCCIFLCGLAVFVKYYLIKRSSKK